MEDGCFLFVSRFHTGSREGRRLWGWGSFWNVNLELLKKMRSFWSISMRLNLIMSGSGPLPCEPSSVGSLSRHLVLPSVSSWQAYRLEHPWVLSRTVKSMVIQIYQKKKSPSMSKKLSLLLGNLRLHQLPDTVAVFFVFDGNLLREPPSPGSWYTRGQGRWGFLFLIGCWEVSEVRFPAVVVSDTSAP